MRKTLSTLAIVALVTGCASSSEMRWSDGTDILNINCSGTGRSWNMCLVKAGELCPEGYDVIGDTSEQGEASMYLFARDADKDLRTPVEYAYSTRTLFRNLYIQCK